MRDDLMTVQIEIDPMLGAPSFRAAEEIAVEAAGGGEIVDRKGQVKRLKSHDRIDASPGPLLSRLSSRLNCG